MKKIGRWVLITLVIFATVVLGTVLIINNYVQRIGLKYIVRADKVTKADAIIVLGAKVFPNGTVSIMLRDRLLESIELYKNGKAKKILVSGDHGHKYYDEVNTMKIFLKNKNIPAKDIFMDHAGFDTYNSIYRARDIFQIKKAIIVTQNFHLIRAVFIARELGLDAYGVKSDKQNYGAVMIKYRLREVFARIKAFFMVKIIKPQPIFLGEIIPITGDGKSTDDKK